MTKLSHPWINRLVYAGILLAFLWAVPLPVSAQNPADYFNISYKPVTFSTNEIQGDQVFTATISGEATCTNDLPVTVSEATITARVVGEATGGNPIVLNPSYTTTIKPFPSKKGEKAEITQVVELRFPGGTEPGEYSVFGEIVEARVKVLTMNMDVTKYLPQRQAMGKVRYISSAQPKPTPTLTSAPTPVPVPKPATPLPAAPPAKESYMSWWVWLLVAVAGAAALFSFVWYLRRRMR